MRYKGPLGKRQVLSVRITETEMGELRQLMELTRMSASELLREALEHYAAQRAGSPPGEARAA